MTGRTSVFLSYRRSDTPHVSGRLGDRLAERYDLFMDIDNIRPGMDFTQVVRDAVNKCDVLLALIGRDWLSATDDDGQRRLDKPRDWVVEEIRAGLQRQITVIPVLVDGAVMPDPEDVPPVLEALTYRHALPLRHESFSADVGRLFDVIDAAVAPTAEKAGSAKPAEPSVPTESDEAAPDIYRDLEYSRALAAMFNRRWDEAVRLLSAVERRFPDNPDVTGRLAEARRRQELAGLEREAAAAEAAGNWRRAVERIQAWRAAEPERGDLAGRLEAAERRLAVQRLADELRGLHTAGEWRGVLATSQRIAQLDPTAADPDGLAADAGRRLAEAEVEDAYAAGLRHLVAGELDEAVAALEFVQSRSPGFRDTADLLRHASGQRDLWAWHMIAAEAEQRGDWHTAVTYLTLMAERDPGFSAAAQRLAYALQRRGLGQGPPVAPDGAHLWTGPVPVRGETARPDPATSPSGRGAAAVGDTPASVGGTAPDPAGGVSPHGPGRPAVPATRSAPVRRAGTQLAVWLTVAYAVLGISTLIYLYSLDNPHRVSHDFPAPAAFAALLLILNGVLLELVGRRNAAPLRSVLRRSAWVGAGLGALIGFALTPLVLSMDSRVSGYILVLLLAAPPVAALVQVRVLQRRAGPLALFPALALALTGLLATLLLPGLLHDVLG